MTISTSPLAHEVALVRAFEGRAEAELTTAELHALREAVGKARRALDVVAATMAGEVDRRSSQDLGAAGFARREGFSTPQQFLAKTLGTSPGDAGRLIAMGQALREDLTESAATNRDQAESESGPATVEGAGAPRYRHLARAISAGILGAEQGALVKRTLDACREAIFAPGVPGTGTGTDAGSDAEARASLVKRLGDIERSLVAKAPTLRLADLRRVCDRERAWCSPKEVAAKERRHVENRTMFFGEDADGMVTMTARMDAASAAPIMAWVDAQTKWAFAQRRSVEDGGAGVEDRRMPGQIRIDALASLARHGLDCGTPTSGVKTTVVVRINEKDLREDLGLAGDEALGDCDQISGPVSVATLRSMAVDARILPVVLGGASLPLDVGRADRYFTAAQRLALVERDGGCSWCHAPPSFCEAHHIKWWARDRGRSDLSNGVMLCTGCHHRIHRDGWDIQVRQGEVWFTPPPSVASESGPRIGGKAHLRLLDTSARAA